MNRIIGIDVSKHKLDCGYFVNLETGKVKTKVWPNDAAGHAQLIDWAQRQSGAQIEALTFVMEATGVYHEALAYALHEAGATVVVANPAQIRDYAKSLAVRTKNDRKDSLVLARFGETQSWRAWRPEPKEIRELRQLLARHTAVQNDLQRERNRQEKAEVSRAGEQVQYSIGLLIEALEQESRRLEKLIDDHIDRHPRLRHDRELLETIPGIGPVVARHILALYHSRDFRSARQMAAYIAVHPVEHQSGSSIRGRPRMSKAGNALLRAKLYLPAVVASTYNPTLKAFYQRLINKGHAKKSALGAVMRKLVHQCFGVLKHQQAYSPTAA